MSSKPTGTLPISNQEFLRFALAMLGGIAVVQLFIAIVADNRITLGSNLLLAVVAIYYAFFAYSYRKRLRMRAYGEYAVHLCGYLLVNGGYWLHAGVLVLSGHSELIGDAWYGVLFGMSLVWGIGLLIHTVGALMTKGHENVHI